MKRSVLTRDERGQSEEPGGRGQRWHVGPASPRDLEETASRLTPTCSLWGLPLPCKACPPLQGLEEPVPWGEVDLRDSPLCHRSPWRPGSPGGTGGKGSSKVSKANSLPKDLGTF